MKDYILPNITYFACFLNPILFTPENSDRKMSIDTVPTDMRNLRACLVCSLVKTMNQFDNDGCENCERFLGLKGDIEKCMECTSANFDGMIAVCEQNDSWVCKWQKIQKKCQGVYAISVSGTLPRPVAQELKQMGIRYKPNQRDKSLSFK